MILISSKYCFQDPTRKKVNKRKIKRVYYQRRYIRAFEKLKIDVKLLYRYHKLNKIEVTFTSYRSIWIKKQHFQFSRHARLENIKSCKKNSVKHQWLKHPQISLLRNTILTFVSSYISCWLYIEKKCFSIFSSSILHISLINSIIKITLFLLN